MMSIARKVGNLIKSSNDILILIHKNPDGDAVGSVLGFAEALCKLNKKTVCFSRDDIPSVFEFLPNVSSIRNKIKPKNYELAVLLDCASFSRTGIENIKEAFSFDNLLVIDHHIRDEKYNEMSFANSVYFIDQTASSTAILIYDIIKKMNLEITKDIATCLLTGIFTDTGSFQHSNTEKKSFEAAAEFMKKGSRVDKIADNIFKNKSISAIKLWGKALIRVKTNKKTGMAVSYIEKEDLAECGAKKEDISGLVETINTISDAKFSLLLAESENEKIKGSFRTEKYKGVDVSEIARNLGGGGHTLASGFEMRGSIEEGISKVNKIIENSTIA